MEAAGGPCRPEQPPATTPDAATPNSAARKARDDAQSSTENPAAEQPTELIGCAKGSRLRS